MLAGIIAGVLPLILKWVAGLVMKSALSEEQKRQFLIWVKQAGTDLGSVMLHKYALAQKIELDGKPFKETE